ncbi:MAG: SIMPL domain-containing protein [Candidatus Binatia bacterium]
MKIWFSAICLLILLPTAALSQQEEKSHRIPSVTATGEAVITAEPDQAEIDVGVVTQARSAPEAAKENAEKLARVMAEVKKLLGKGDEVKTASYSLNPNYRYAQERKPEITGYTATNILRIKTGNLTNVGKLIDVSMQSGANAINRLAFMLKDEHAAQLQALRVASQKAKDKTEEIAAALGLKITRILAVTEGERAVRPLTMPLARGAQREAMAPAPTPVEAGTIEVRSTVTLTAELGAR